MPSMTPREIRQLRDRLQMTQDEFARVLGVNVYHVSRLEHGARKPSGPLNVLLRLYAADPALTRRAG